MLPIADDDVTLGRGSENEVESPKTSHAPACALQLVVT